MPAPTFVSYTAVSVWTNNTTPKTVNVAVQTGDVIVVGGGCEAADIDIGPPSDGVNTYTARQTVDSNTASQSIAVIWTATAATSTTLTISVARGAAGKQFGFGVWVWRNATIGTSASNGPTGGTSGAPSQAITTTAANSALCLVSTDWNAADGTSRTWRDVNGAHVEDSYERNSASYTIYAGHHVDAAGAGSKTVGLSAPAGQSYSIATIEILGPVLPDVTVARFAQ